MKTLVIHATAGAGHKKAAEAIYNGLKAEPPESPLSGGQVRLVDALEYTNPFFKRTYPSTYAFLVTRLPFVWAVFFGLLDLSWLQPLVRLARRIYNGLNARRLEQFLIEEQFDCIITTQFLSAEVSAYLKSSGKIKAKVICVVTDFDVHRIWVNAGIDVYAVATPWTKAKIISLGVPADRVFVTGIPTDAPFAQAVDRAALKAKLGLKENIFTVLIATGSFGMGPIEQLIDLLGKYQLLVVCGHNQQLFRRLQSKILSFPNASIGNLGHAISGPPITTNGSPRHEGETFGGDNYSNVHIWGLVNNMHELMSVADAMITKPGGLSIAEALVKHLPMVFFSAIPGQETRNIMVLKEYGAAQDQMPVDAIARAIDDWNASPQELQRLRQNLAALAKPNAVNDIIKIIGFPP